MHMGMGRLVCRHAKTIITERLCLGKMEEVYLCQRESRKD